MRRISVLLALLSALAFVLAACSGDGPQDLTFDLGVEHRELVPAGDVVVSQGDTVTLSFTVDEPGELHLHGYDLKTAAAPGEPGVISFEATATGRFGLMFHLSDAMHEEDDAHAEDDHSEEELDIVLGALEVRP